MKKKASTSGQNIYQRLDQVARTGIPLEIERKGFKLKIILVGKVSKLENLKKRKCLKGDPEDIVHMDWFKNRHAI